MNERTNLEIIRSTYEGPSSSNAQHLMDALSEQVEWTEAAGFPYGGTYIGVEAVMENVFSRLASEWNDYKASVHTYHEVEGKDVIIAEGVYSGIYKQSGKAFQADFVHVWELSNGKVVKFKQYVDSHTVQQAMVLS
ncbi:nuclear transport factor 2 family protein [Bacillus sp. DX1.1]|uniref:nuclear transport factor 2 family protein n=1 Tax=unclassified Bacillus (in: firmicutes) TaxID=185979 RepID=UPI00256FDA2A|nr:MULTISPECIES: nuclear transport factor 2 family protein [unclassified Bacillus (in: firmicutes)]MDM5154477.1 nuclear transport factor 2 family protein [Bacillus sp. DX1.1]WJE83378.1 nuclear transport factor 2 family protein [Bacillus sp. DX3.1]